MVSNMVLTHIFQYLADAGPCFEKCHCCEGDRSGGCGTDPLHDAAKQRAPSKAAS